MSEKFCSFFLVYIIDVFVCVLPPFPQIVPKLQIPILCRRTPSTAYVIKS